jgi:hypothetical protein
MKRDIIAMARNAECQWPRSRSCAAACTHHGRVNGGRVVTHEDPPEHVVSLLDTDEAVAARGMVTSSGRALTSPLHHPPLLGSPRYPISWTAVCGCHWPKPLGGAASPVNFATPDRRPAGRHSIYSGSGTDHQASDQVGYTPNAIHYLRVQLSAIAGLVRHGHGAAAARASSSVYAPEIRFGATPLA